MSSDASLTTIAASIRDSSEIIDTTSEIETSNRHINIKEAEAVLLGLKKFKDLIKGKTLAIALDSQVVLYNLRAASSTNLQIRLIIKEIYRILIQAEPERVWFSFIPSKRNTMADKLSRPSKEDWKLNQMILQQIVEVTGFYPQIELFSDETNNILPKFITELPNRRAVGNNAFMIPWGRLPNTYANPPFSLMFRVLSKIIKDKSNTMLVAPFWPTRPWWPLIHRANYLYRLPVTRETFSFLGKTHLPTRWIPIVAIFLNGGKNESTEGREIRVENLPLIGWNNRTISLKSNQLTPLHNHPPLRNLVPSDLVTFKQSLDPMVKMTRSSIVL
jgi:hypothetical protein